MQASALGRILHTAFLTSAGVSEAAKELTVSLSSSIEPGGDLRSSARQMPQNQKSRGDKSGLWGGQTLSVRLEIILFPNFSSPNLDDTTKFSKLKYNIIFLLRRKWVWLGSHDFVSVKTKHFYLK